MAERAGQSLPKQMADWAELKGAYRFLNNPQVKPRAIGQAHRAGTIGKCQSWRVVLCVQDDTEIHGAKVAGGQGGDHGEVLHTTLAVTPEGGILGILDQRWFRHIEPVKGETQKQRAARWRETDVWEDAVLGMHEAADARGGWSAECRRIQVADRASDNLRFMHACLKKKDGFVIRAQHDRRVEEQTTKLWEHMESQPVAGSVKVKIGQQRTKSGQIKRQSREAVLSLRYATVQLDAPKNHPGEIQGLAVQAVYLVEENPPEGVEAVDWMLLTSEPVRNLEEALVIVGYYQRRWVIEEWHRVLKEGCRLEDSQLETVDALRNLSALLSVVAKRLMELRDLARQPMQDASTLRGCVDLVWIQVVATLAKMNPQTLTARGFWRTIAKRGGFIGRKSDGQPGWKTIWRGWYDVSQMVHYADLLQTAAADRK